MDNILNTRDTGTCINCKFLGAIGYLGWRRCEYPGFKDFAIMNCYSVQPFCPLCIPNAKTKDSEGNQKVVIRKNQ